MAGKKAKCKKCGVSFRIPGGDAPTGDTAGDSQMLSAMDLPIPESAADPFDFAAPTPQPVAKKSVAIPKPEPKAPAPLLPKPAAKLPPPKPPALKLKDDEAPAEPLSLGDDDEIPAVAPGSGNPFGFSDAAAEGDGFAFDNARPAPAKRNSKTKLMSDEEEGEPLVEKEPKPARGYNSKDAGGKSSTGKLILIVGVFGLVVGSVIAGTMIYLNSKKGTEQVGAEKKDEKKETPVPTSDPIPTPAKDDKKGGEVPPPKGGEKTAPKKEPGGKKPQTPVAGAMLKLGPSPTIQFAAMAANRMNVQEPSIRLAILPNLPGKGDSAFTLSRKVFPPLKRDLDVGVLWQTEPGFQGRGEKLLLGIYSPLSGKQQNQVAFEGDGSPEPACDLSVSGDLFAHAHTGDGKITVWDTRKSTKVIDGFNPYADKKDLKLAAVYLTEPPDALIAVSTTGAVHAFKIPTKEPIAGEFVPSKTSSKPLVAGKSIAPGPGRQSVVLVAGGIVYGVNVTPTVSGSVVAEIGDVGRSFGLAASGGQKLLYAFETDADGKKEKAVMEVRGDGKHIFYRWPEKDAGEPTVVGWVGDDLGMVGTDRGACVWFEAEGNTFRAIGLAKTPNDKARHVASDGHWSLLPDPTDTKKCVLVEYSKPQTAIVDVLGNVKQSPTVLLSDKALFK